MLKTFTKKQTDPARAADQKFLQSLPELKAKQPQLAQQLATVQAMVDRGERTPAALVPIEHAQHAISVQLARVGEVRGRLIDSCPDDELRLQAKKLRGRKVPTCNEIKSAKAAIAEAQEVIKRCSDQLPTCHPDDRETTKRRIKHANTDLVDGTNELRRLEALQATELAELADVYEQMIQA